MLLTLKLTTCTDKTFPNTNTSPVDVANIQTFSDIKLSISAEKNRTEKNGMRGM